MIINSLIDQDLYKLNMLQFIVDQKYDKLITGWKFFPRGENKFPIGFGERLKEEVDSWSSLKFEDDELDFLYEKTRNWINYDFIYGYLKSYRLDTSLINITINKCEDSSGEYELISLEYEGQWAKTILFEVMLMAVMVEIEADMTVDTNHRLDFTNFVSRNGEKFQKMKDNNLQIFEFGTRRRRSHLNQDIVIKQMIDYDVIKGTSNLYFAKKYNLPIFGTMAHELYMIMAALYGVQSANQVVLDKWCETFDGNLGTFLTDTYTTDYAYKHSFKRKMGLLYTGVREDSATCTKEFVDKTIQHYESLGINPKHKVIIHSNGIDSVDKMIELLSYRKDEIGRELGVGTFLTNDSLVDPKQKLNGWVIKPIYIITNGEKRHTVKLSDTAGKVTTMDNKTADCYKYLIGLE